MIHSSLTLGGFTKGLEAISTDSKGHVVSIPNGLPHLRIRDTSIIFGIEVPTALVRDCCDFWICHHPGCHPGPDLFGVGPVIGSTYSFELFRVGFVVGCPLSPDLLGVAPVVGITPRFVLLRVGFVGSFSCCAPAHFTLGTMSIVARCLDVKLPQWFYVPTR